MGLHPYLLQYNTVQASCSYAITLTVATVSMFSVWMFPVAFDAMLSAVNVVFGNCVSVHLGVGVLTSCCGINKAGAIQARVIMPQA